MGLLSWDRQHAVDFLVALRQHAGQYGYEAVETPLIDSAELFLTKAGDQLITRLFTFERHGRQLALRPEFTAAAAALYSHYASDTIVRWYFSGPVFEDTPGQSQQDYQHLSAGAELIGMGGPAADAEVISLAAHGLLRQNVPNWHLIIGHVGLTRRLLDQYSLDYRTHRFLLNHLPTLKIHGKDYVLRLLERSLLGSEGTDENDENGVADGTDAAMALNTRQMLDVLLDATQRGVTMGGRTRQDIALRLLEKRRRAADYERISEALIFLERWGQISQQPQTALDAIQPFIPREDRQAQTIYDEWRTLLELLGIYEVPADRVRIQPDLARNWDYYTGVVFELRAEDDNHLGGGGRYDELISLLGGRSVPAVGFAYYIDKLLAAARSRTAQPAALAIVFSADQQVAASRWAHLLRKHDLPVRLLPDHLETTNLHVLRLNPAGAVCMGSDCYSMSEMNQLIDRLPRADSWRIV